MDSILFILLLACLPLVAGWYVGNEATKSEGAWGLLAIGAPKGEARAAAVRYEVRTRIGPARTEPSPHERAIAAAPERTPRFVEKGPRGRFLDRDESGYRTRGRLPLASDDARKPLS